MKILKFGGSSMGSPEMIKQVADIVLKASKKEKVLVVVSAMSGVTDMLDKLCEYAGNGDKEKTKKILKKLEKKHKIAADKICGKSCDLEFRQALEQNIADLETIVEAITLLKQISPRGKAKILYFGEILSSLLLVLAIKYIGGVAKNFLSKDILMCKGDFLDGEFLEEESKQNFKKNKKAIFKSKIPVFTGFGGGDKDENIYLFDRGGSDYVASLFGLLTKAKNIEIWTDVSNVMSADPRIVKNPLSWKSLDYSIAAELAISGAKILHPKTISPVKKINSNLIIKNTFNPKASGTTIKKVKENGIKGINIDNSQIIMSFIDPSMIGTFGYVSDITKIFKDLKIPLDTLATTETSVSISIKKKHFSKKLLDSLKHLEEHFKLLLEKDVSKISIVGNNIDNYEILTKLKNVLMISEGAYKKSLTIFVKKQDKKELLIKLHKIIFNK